MARTVIFAGLIFVLVLIFPKPGFAQEYVARQGEKLLYQQNELFVYGATIYPYWSFNSTIFRGSGWTRPEFTQYLDYITNLAKLGKVNTLRITNFLDGTSNPYDAVVWSNIDYLFTNANINHLFLILDLSTYRNLLRRQNTMPYNANLWNNFLDFVANRYKNQSRLLSYEIAGEVEAINDADPLRPSSTSALTQFYSGTSTRLRAGDPNHLVSTGGLLFLNWDSGIDWQAIFGLTTIDFAAIHQYSQGDLLETLPAVSQWAQSHQKPFSVEEFGYTQGLGDQTRANNFQTMHDALTNVGGNVFIFWNLGPETAAASHDVGPQTPLVWNWVKTHAPQPLPEPSPGVFDLNGDGQLTPQDIKYLILRWLSKTLTPADLGNDGTVNSFDFSRLREALVN